MEVSKRRYTKKFILLSIFALVVAIGLLIQFDNPAIQGKPVTAAIEGPQEVVAILERSCYNCHSNKVNLSWYDQVAPISWAVKKDVDRAREVMNFSEWGNLSKAEQKGKFWGILNMIKSGKMPLKSYVTVHPEAKVSATEFETIKRYVLSLPGTAPTDTGRINTANQEYATWSAKENQAKAVQKSPNGIVYSDDFKSWKVISTSKLYDNSLRVIYGNDIAVKAIEEENFHPWPDGAIVVKAVWEQVENKYGEVRPGKFVNAQFMVKDAKKYPDTEGWGFAKFSGLALKPTGTDASFAVKSCISCHRQLAEETGYLFNVPLKVNPKN